MPSSTQQIKGFILRLLGLGRKYQDEGAELPRQKAARLQGARAASEAPGPAGSRPRVGPPGAKDLNSGGWRGRRARAWRYFPRKAGAAAEFADRPHPPVPTRGKKKKKVEGRRGEEPPRFLPQILRKGWGGAGREGADRADQWQSTGPGLGRAAGPASPRRPGPSPPPRPRSAKHPARPGCRLPCSGPDGGGGRGGGGAGGSPAENPPAGLAAQGEGLRVPEWRIRKDSGSTRARPARGILGKKWPSHTGREPRGAEVRGQGPGARRAELPHVNAASGRNLFVFHRASMLPYWPGCGTRGAASRLSAHPTPSTASTQPNSPLPLDSSQPPAWGWQERSKFALTTSGGGCIYSSLSSLLPPSSPRLLTLLQTRTININMCHCNRAGNIRILRWGGVDGGLVAAWGAVKKKIMFHVLDVFGSSPHTRIHLYRMQRAPSHLVTETHKSRFANNQSVRNANIFKYHPSPPSAIAAIS